MNAVNEGLERQSSRAFGERREERGGGRGERREERGGGRGRIREREEIKGGERKDRDKNNEISFYL